MNTKTIQLPTMTRQRRRLTTIFTLAAILGIVLAITDIHRYAFALVWPYIIAAYDFMGLPVS